LEQTPSSSSSSSSSTKTVAELETELSAKKAELDSLFSQNTDSNQGSLYATLTPADYKRELSERRLFLTESTGQNSGSPQPSQGPLSLFALSDWISFAVILIGGLLLFTFVFRLINTLVKRGMKEDFIK
jgi:hypothetical protein